MQHSTPSTFIWKGICSLQLLLIMLALVRRQRESHGGRSQVDNVGDLTGWSRVCMITEEAGVARRFPGSLNRSARQLVHAMEESGNLRLLAGEARDHSHRAA